MPQLIPHVQAESDSWKVDENTDDARVYTGLWGFSYSETATVVGHLEHANYMSCDSYLRWDNISIPKDSTIIHAYLKPYTFVHAGYPLTKIWGIDEDNATNYAVDPSGRDLTSASVDWNGVLGGNVYRTSPDIKTVIQELVDRDGWVSGNAIGLKWGNDGGTGLNRVSYSTLPNTPAIAAILEIEWLAPVYPPSDPIDLFGAGFNASFPYVELYWNHSLVDVQFFEVQSSSDGESWSYMAQTNYANYTDTQVVNGTEKYYRVRACKYVDPLWYNSSWTDVNFEKVHFILGTGEFICVPQFFNASSIDVIVGTLNDGYLNSTYFVDGDWYNVSEVTGPPGLDIRVNFTDVGVGCGCFEFYQTYLGHSQHEIEVQIWNFTSTAWTTLGPVFFNETANWACIGLGHYYTHFFSEGNLYARLYHEGVGHVAHELQIDRIDLGVIQEQECPPALPVDDYSIIFLAIGLILTLCVAFLYVKNR